MIPRRPTLIAATALTVGLLVPSSQALAATVRPSLSPFGSFTGQSPQSLAADQSNGDLYAISPGFDDGNTVSRFDAAGNPKNFTAGPDAGTNTLTGLIMDPGPSDSQVAVDRSAGPGSGDIYVTNTYNGTVDAFASDGTPLGSFNGSGNASGFFSFPCGVAVDQSNGDVYIGDYDNNIWRYSPSSATPSEADFSGGLDPGFNVCQLAAQSGSVYAANLDATGPVERFSASDFATGTPPAPAGVTVDSTATALATDPASGDLYVDEGSRVAVFDSSGAALYSFASGESGSAGVAVIASAGAAYVANPTANRIDAFGPPVAVPDVTTKPATASTQTTADLHGHLDPAGAGDITDCHFEYVTDAAFQATGFTDLSSGGSVLCDQSTPIAAPTAVTVTATGLASSTKYDFRLVASNANGENQGQSRNFGTHGPGFGFSSFDGGVFDQNGDPVTQAGSHPYQATTSFFLNRGFDPAGQPVPDGTAKDLEVDLPPGFVGDPTAVPRCDQQDFIQFGCPDDTAVGILAARTASQGGSEKEWTPVFNLDPPPGVPAEFGFNYVAAPVRLDASVRTGGDYGLTVSLNNINATQALLDSTATFWGVPADPSHDPFRGHCLASGGEDPASNGNCPSSQPLRPFLTLPTSCTGPQTTTIRADSWENPGVFASASFLSHDNSGTPIGASGCSALGFAPTLQARPTTNAADSPSGLDVDLHIPQNNSVNGLATAHLKKTVVALPEGLVVNPSAANGLGACSSAQIALHDPDPANCPDAAKLGTVEVDTPLLDHPLQGAVYIAKPFDNPFDSLLAIYITINDPQTGTVVKLAGHVVADPDTGRLTTTFDDNPQLPFSDFKLNFFGGPAGALRTPAACGAYSTSSEMTPWSGTAPVTPHDDYSISQAPGGGSCPGSEGEQPNAPSFDAGTVTPVAGSFSPFVVNLRRADDTQQFSTVTVNPPPGMVAKLAGTPACSDAALIAASNKSGQDELANPSCPASSQVGTVDVAAGAGPDPYNTTGKAYMAGPYKGAPLSLAIVTPATAGPFDLGTVVVRTAIHLDPASAQITAVSDPIPSILQGINLDVRSASIKLDKPNFTLNGTSCDPSQVTGSLLSTLGQSASLSDRFQLGECANLGFKPNLKLSLKGGTKRNGHPAFTSVLTYPTGAYANLRKAAVTLPPTMQLDQSHIKAPCTRPQFAANQCPAASVIGTATATSPLLDYALSGPVYLRTGNNPLPDVVLALHGPATQPLEFDVVGKVDTVHARLRTTFETVPDAPVSKAVISLQGNSKGLLVNNTNLCAQTNRATVLLDGQNNKVSDSTPTVGVKCPKPHKKHHKRHHQRHSGR